MYEIVSKIIIKIFMILILGGLLVGSLWGTHDSCSATDNNEKFQKLTKQPFTASEPNKNGLINASRVNIRQGPNLESDIIGTITDKGTIVEVMGRNGAWYKVRIGGIEGWVYVNYVSWGETIDEPKQNQLSHVETAKVIARDRWFVAYNDGVVYDQKTGLEWYAGPDRDTNWNEAKSWVENLTVAGGGWRMPTWEELKTLYIKGVGERNMTPLLKTTGSWVWSGETKGAKSAWFFNFIHGYTGFCYRGDPYEVRGFAVRSRR